MIINSLILKIVSIRVSALSIYERISFPSLHLFCYHLYTYYQKKKKKISLKANYVQLLISKQQHVLAWRENWHININGVSLLNIKLIASITNYQRCCYELQHMKHKNMFAEKGTLNAAFIINITTALLSFFYLDKNKSTQKKVLKIHGIIFSDSRPADCKTMELQTSQ